MKKNLLLIIVAFVAVLVIVLLGNVVLIGDRLMRLHVSLGYLFYALLVVLLVWLVVLPLLRIMNAPAVPALDVKPAKDDGDKLYKLGVLVAKNSRHIDNKADRKAHQAALIHRLDEHREDADALAGLVAEEIDHRMSLIDGTIREKALSIFLITALSQNGKFDFLSSVIINLQLIHRVVVLSGFRPTYGQLTRLYIEVIVASFITDFSDDFLGDVDFSAVLGSVKIPSILVKSVVDGSVSAVMTMRIGYIAKAYIRKGTIKLTDRKRSAAFRKSARREAIKQSVKNLPSLVKEGFNQMTHSSSKAMGGWLKYVFKGY